MGYIEKLLSKKLERYQNGLLYGDFPGNVPTFLGNICLEKRFDWIKTLTAFDKGYNYFKNMGEILQNIKRYICPKVFYKRFTLKKFSKFMRKFQWICLL